MPSLPYSARSDFVEALGELVPDAKGGYSDDVFIDDANREYARHHPAEETADVGDGSTQEWQLGKAAEPFVRWDDGFSSEYQVQVERLDSDGDPYRPQDWLVPRSDFWIERRYADSAPRWYLVFESAPDATSQVRVHYKRPPVLTEATVEVPEAHQRAVVYLACALKCEALASYYQQTVDAAGGSDGFEALAYVQQYRDQADRWRKLASGQVGVQTSSSGFKRGKIRTPFLGVFPRGHG